MRGRFHARPGDVLLHAAFDSHLDRFLPRPTEILNLPIRRPLPASFWAGRIADPDAVMRLAERDCEAAAAALLAQLSPILSGLADWPDLLAQALVRNPDRRLDEWAARMGLAPETVSRGFKRVYGITPRQFRTEVRARHALALMEQPSPIPLASIALRAGFADQPHMTRAVRSLTGVAPGAWRRRQVGSRPDGSDPVLLRG